VGESFQFEVATKGTTTALVYRAREPLGATLILAHGAGTSQTHPFMIDMATRLAAHGIDVVTFNFLYTEQGRKMPDREGALVATWQAAIASVIARGGLGTERLFCGGKSMGGRIVSNLAASAAGDGLRLAGLVFLGYPLHPQDKPKVRRDEHLPRVPFPMLFVQGSRDALGSSAEIRALVRRLPHASVHIVEGGDHSLAIPKRGATITQSEALEGVAEAIAAFVRPRPPRAPRARGKR
jgi:hypothetical protein